MQTESALTSFLKPWMLDNTSGNILQIFIFDHIHFLVKDVVLLPPHWLANSTQENLKTDSIVCERV